MIPAPLISLVRVPARHTLLLTLSPPLSSQDRVILGSDYPFPLGEPHPGQCIEEHDELTNEQKVCWARVAYLRCAKPSACVCDRLHGKPLTHFFCPQEKLRGLNCLDYLGRKAEEFL